MIPGRFGELTIDLRRRFAAARVWAAREAPYLASALLALDPVVIEREDGDVVNLSAFPVDLRWHVYVDPVELEAATVPEVGFWLLHQVSHLLREHARRYPGPAADEGTLWRRTPEQRRWNLATDAEIDDDLHTERLVLPARAVTHETIGMQPGWLAEQYWDGLGSATRRAGVTERGRSYDCGSGCDGQSRPWNCDRPGLAPSACKLVARDAARRIREHVRSRGELPAGWQRWADEILEPTVDWRRELAAHIRRGSAEVSGRVDFTYRRPSRRAAAFPDVVLPSLRQPLPRVALVIDTSGSMSDGMLGQALGEVGGVLRSLGVGRRSTRIVCCDAQAYESQSVRDLGSVVLPGGGGTDMGAGIQAAAELRPGPDLIVVLTDGLTPWPPVPPAGKRVIVGLMDDRGTSPHWATTVRVGDVLGAAR